MNRNGGPESTKGFHAMSDEHTGIEAVFGLARGIAVHNHLTAGLGLPVKKLRRCQTISDGRMQAANPRRTFKSICQITADPGAWGTPPGANATRRGRPSGRTKEQVTVRIDKDVLAALQTPDPKGWQTRLNEALRAGLKL